jgi:hypothetical protein
MPIARRRSLHARYRLKLPSIGHLTVCAPGQGWRLAGVLKDIQRGGESSGGASTSSLHTKRLLHAPRPSFARRSSFLTLLYGELIVNALNRSIACAPPRPPPRAGAFIRIFLATNSGVGGGWLRPVTRLSQLGTRVTSAARRHISLWKLSHSLTPLTTPAPNQRE